MYKLTAADFADTGQWRLLIKIGRDGLEAYLENTLHPEIELQEMCKVGWKTDRSALCRRIEEAVYNHPRLLDDFATRIIIYDDRTLFIPTEIAEKEAGAEEEQYRKVYDADATDILTYTEGELTVVWSPGPGVKGFLMRTFPGARIMNNLMERVKETRNDKETTEGKKLYKEVRDGEVDLILMEGKKLLSASTHEWKRREEIDEMVKKLLEVYENN